jgi:hypothetical protein
VSAAAARGWRIQGPGRRSPVTAGSQLMRGRKSKYALIRPIVGLVGDLYGPASRRIALLSLLSLLSLPVMLLGASGKATAATASPTVARRDRHSSHPSVLQALL